MIVRFFLSFMAVNKGSACFNYCEPFAVWMAGNFVRHRLIVGAVAFATGFTLLTVEG